MISYFCWNPSRMGTLLPFGVFVLVSVQYQWFLTEIDGMPHFILMHIKYDLIC